jgi:hypothetical protein
MILATAGCQAGEDSTGAVGWVLRRERVRRGEPRPLPLGFACRRGRIRAVGRRWIRGRASRAIRASLGGTSHSRDFLRALGRWVSGLWTWWLIPSRGMGNENKTRFGGSLWRRSVIACAQCARTRPATNGSVDRGSERQLEAGSRAVPLLTTTAAQGVEQAALLVAELFGAVLLFDGSVAEVEPLSGFVEVREAAFQMQRRGGRAVEWIRGGSRGGPSDAATRRRTRGRCRAAGRPSPTRAGRWGRSPPVRSTS